MSAGERIADRSHAKASPQDASRRIIFVNRYFSPDESATSQMLTDLASRLASNQLDVRVITSRQRYDDPTAALAPREVIAGVEVYRVWTCRFGRNQLVGRALDYLSFYLSAAWRMWWLVRPRDVIVAKTDPPMLSLVGAAIAKLRGATLINWLQDVFPEVATHLDVNPLPSSVNRALMSIRDASLRAARYNVVLGTRMRDYLAARGISAGSLRVIENWADGTAIQPQTTDGNALRIHHGWQNHFVVMYSGNLGRAHEWDTLLSAAKLLCDHKDIVFVMIGGGVKMRAMQAAVDRYRIGNVAFLPYQPRESLAESLSAADVHLACLLPALEGLIVPSKFYGILAAGRPVVFIGDTRGELAGVIESWRCGFVAAIGDAKSIADEILRLKQNVQLVMDQGERARLAFDTRYTLEAAVQKWNAILDRLDQTSLTGSDTVKAI